MLLSPNVAEGLQRRCNWKRSENYAQRLVNQGEGVGGRVHRGVKRRKDGAHMEHEKDGTHHPPTFSLSHIFPSPSLPHLRGSFSFLPIQPQPLSPSTFP